MNYSPLVSCIINFLNTEKFLAEAIESVFAQSYEHWELILVDDGSTDNSTGIARQYARQHPGRVRYLEHDRHKNRGTSASRNLGIAHAEGKYIAFLDSDDIWLPHKLKTQVALLETHPEAGMVYGALYYWYGWTGKPEDVERDRVAEIWNFPHESLVRYPEYLPLFLREQVLIPSPTNLLVRREVAGQAGGFEDDFRDLFDDQIFVVKMSIAAPVLLIQGVYEKWRRHEGSITYISENITGEGERMRPVFLNSVEKYLLDSGVKDAVLWWTLKKELLPYRFPRFFYLYERMTQVKDQLINRGGKKV